MSCLCTAVAILWNTKCCSDTDNTLLFTTNSLFFLSFPSIPLNYACCFHHSHSSKDIFFCQLMVQWKCEGMKNGRLLHWRIVQMNSVDIHWWQRAAREIVEVQRMLLKSVALLVWGSMWRVRETLGLPYIRVNTHGVFASFQDPIYTTKQRFTED